MTRGRVYRGQEANLRGAGVILVGSNGAIPGSRPGNPSKGIEEAMHGERTEPIRRDRMRYARAQLVATPDQRISATGTLRPGRKAPARPTRDLPAEMPPVTEWDNPFVKSRFTKAESRHRGALRRARIKAASDPANPVIRSEIIKRDGATCWICERPVPKPQIELDHVIPIALGGKHIPENVRVACRSCNTWHGNRIVTPMR